MIFSLVYCFTDKLPPMTRSLSTYKLLFIETSPPTDKLVFMETSDSAVNFSLAINSPFTVAVLPDLLNFTSAPASPLAPVAILISPVLESNKLTTLAVF